MLVWKGDDQLHWLGPCYVGTACTFKDGKEHAFIGNHRLRRLNLPHLRRDTRRSQTPTVRTEVTTMLALSMAITDRAY
jgi:hypothetical protein